MEIIIKSQKVAATWTTTRAPVGVDKPANFQFWLPGLPHARVEAGKHPGGRLPSKSKKSRGEKKTHFPPAWAAPHASWSWWGEGGRTGGAASTKAEGHGGFLLSFSSYLLIFAYIWRSPPHIFLIFLLTIVKMIQLKVKLCFFLSAQSSYRP